MNVIQPSRKLYCCELKGNILNFSSDLLLPSHHSDYDENPIDVQFISYEQFFTANASHSLHALSSNFLYTCW